MTVLSAIQSAVLKFGVAYPTAVFGQTPRELQELAALTNSAAAMIAFDTGHDWTKLKTLATLTGDSVALGFDYPSDYERMLKKASLWPSGSPFQPLKWFADTDQWLGGQVIQTVPFLGAWTMIGDEIQVRMGGWNDPLPTGSTVEFYYISKNYALDVNGDPQPVFSADTDTFRLPERLLTLALVYIWKQAKGQDYQEALSDYENMLMQAVGRDRGQADIAVGPVRIPGNVQVAYPWPLGS